MESLQSARSGGRPDPIRDNRTARGKCGAGLARKENRRTRRLNTFPARLPAENRPAGEVLRGKAVGGGPPGRARGFRQGSGIQSGRDGGPCPPPSLNVSRSHRPYGEGRTSLLGRDGRIGVKPAGCMFRRGTPAATASPLVRLDRIELSIPLWKSGVLPLNYSRRMRPADCLSRRRDQALLRRGGLARPARGRFSPGRGGAEGGGFGPACPGGPPPFAGPG